MYLTGDVIVRLHPYYFDMVGIRSEHDLMNNDFGSYGEVMNNAWTGGDVKGFGKIFGNQTMMYRLVNKENDK